MISTEKTRKESLTKDKVYIQSAYVAIILEI